MIFGFLLVIGNLRMASVSLFVFFFIAHLVSLHSAEDEGIYPPNCPPFVCGKLGKIGFPFADHTRPECGLCILYDCGEGNPTNKTTPKIQLERNGTKLYDVEGISQADTIKIFRERNSAVAFEHGQIGCDLKKDKWRAGKSEIV